MGKEEEGKEQNDDEDGEERNRKEKKEKGGMEINLYVPDLNNKSMFFDVIYVVFVNRVIFEKIDEHHQFITIKHESINIREV